MTVATRQLRASYAFFERNYHLIKRYWAWEMVWLAYSIADSLAVSYIGLGMEVLTGNSVAVDGRYLVLYLLIGTLVWRYLSSIFHWITEVISIERWEGTIEYTLMAPVPRIIHMVGHTAFAVLYSIIFTGVILAATTFLFDLDLSNANLLGGAIVLLAGSFSFVGIGVVGAVLPLLFPERGAQMTHIIVATLLLISGVYYPVEVLPRALEAMSVISPAWYVLEGVRAALIEGASLAELWPFIWPALALALVTVPAGLWTFAQAERYAKRKGKLARNG
ncbi:MAG: ABC transporter permease [Chloroflexi bacterium]|nr:ABC transporter permease [Chloroflexota bacterium]MCI0727478.1 ABC transporter permease [Chloroflexota bacterium]